MEKVRLGIIGLGNIGQVHADYLMKGVVSGCELVAVGSGSAEKRARYSQKGVKAFSDGESLIHSREVDAVLIATPHWQHPALGITAFDAGIHALIEKPIAAHKADAERLIAAHKRNPKTIFGGMFQMRAEPRYQAMRKLIRSGELGRIVRVNWINTDWYRTEAYYASGGWRASWRGEGGGVLLNQSLHNLDVLQWLCGMPARVRGFCRFGRFHDIEVEDEATAYLEWADGATGLFVSSTGEAPGANRFELVGSKATVVLEKDRLTVTCNETDMIEFSHRAGEGFLKPEAHTEEIPVEKAAQPHAVLTQNFVNAVLDGEPLLAPGEDGLQPLELANAIVYSSLEDRTLDLPLDGAAWETRLNQLIAESKR